MKRFLAILVAVLLCVSSCAVLAENSKGEEDMTKAITDEEVAGLSIFLIGDGEFLAAADHPEEKLAEAESIPAFFGDKNGAIAGILGEGGYVVNEFTAVGAEGVDDLESNIGVTFLFPTPFAIDKTVVVMIGQVEEDITWTAYQGIGVDASEYTTDDTAGGVWVSLDPDMLKYIQENGALLAIVQLESDIEG